MSVVQAPPSPASDPPSSSAGSLGWPVAIIATLGMSVSYIDRATLGAIAPMVRSALDIPHVQYGWLVSGFSMAYLVGAPIAGAVVDRLGARRGFALAVVVWSVIAGLHALATSFAVLFALRILLGAAESPSFPAAAQSIRRALPARRRSAAYGMLFIGSSVGGMIAAPLAVALAARHGFRFAFVGTAVVGACWLPVWLFMTRGGRLAPERTAPAGDPDAPAPWRALLRTPAVLRSLVAIVGSAPSAMLVQNWTSQYLVERWQVPKTGVGGHLVVPLLFFDVGAVGFGLLATRLERSRADHELGAARATHNGLFLAAGALVATLALTPLAPSVPVAVALLGLSSAGVGGLNGLITADLMARVPVSRTAAAGGLCAGAQSLAHIVASPLVGLLIDRTHGYGAALVSLGLLSLPTTMAFVLWAPVRQR
ncbi:MAG: D-galactonate transporter [Labilithrix sp.]|nr:D-galactonate transporter [Labilithrix sp.]